MSFKQGNIVWLDMQYTDFSDEKERPVLIISNSELQNVDEVIAMKITKTHRGYGFSYEIKPNMLESGTLPAALSCLEINVVQSMSVQIFSSRKKPLKLKREYLEEVLERFSDLIELE